MLAQDPQRPTPLYIQFLLYKGSAKPASTSTEYLRRWRWRTAFSGIENRLLTYGQYPSNIYPMRTYKSSYVLISSSMIHFCIQCMKINWFFFVIKNLHKLLTPRASHYALRGFMDDGNCAASQHNGRPYRFSTNTNTHSDQALDVQGACAPETIFTLMLLFKSNVLIIYS